MAKPLQNFILKKKIFILDTNVLIHDPVSICSFGTHDVVIPFIVLKELDRLKKGPGEIAASARTALRMIDRLREKGSLMKGVLMETGGLLSIGTVLSSAANTFMDDITEDNKIINTALGVLEERRTDEQGNLVPVTLVSKDTTVRIRRRHAVSMRRTMKATRQYYFRRMAECLKNPII